MENRVEKNLQYFLKQETYVFEQCADPLDETDRNDVEDLEYFFQTHRDNTDYSLIFNFFFGDEASETLGYQTHGISSLTGFDLIKINSH